MVLSDEGDRSNDCVRVLEPVGREEDVDPGDVTLLGVQLPVLAEGQELLEDLLGPVEPDVLRGEAESLGEFFLKGFGSTWC